MRFQAGIVEQNDRRQRKYNDRDRGEDQFPPVIPIVRKPGLDLLPKDALPEQDIKDQEGDAGDHVIFIRDIPKLM